MIDKLGPRTLYDAFDLAVVSNITPQVSSRRVLTQVTNPYLVARIFKRTYQRPADRPAAASHERPHGPDRWRRDLKIPWSVACGVSSPEAWHRENTGGSGIGLD